MARSPLLSEARGTTGFDDVGHIAQRVPVLRGIGRLKITAHGRTATIVIHNHRIFLRVIEVLGQVETAIDRITLGISKVPVLAGTNLGIAKGSLAIEEELRVER